MFKEKKPFYLDFQLLLLILLLIIFSVLVYIRLKEPIPTEKITPDINLLNSLSEDNKLTNDIFIINNKIDDYQIYITNLIKNNIPKDIYNDIFQKKLSYYYKFYDSYMTLNYDLGKIYETDKIIEIPIVYNEINDMLNLLYDNNIIYNEKPQEYKYAISMTFDDGPNNNKTEEILSYLKEYDFTATFFMVGNKLLTEAETVKSVDKQGSEIGYHSMNHSYFTKQDSSIIKNELSEANNILKSIIGKEFKIARAPYGSYNEKTIEALNMPLVLWSIDTNDWRYKDVDYLIEYVKNNNKERDIILMHDSYQTSADAVKEILKYFYINDIKVLSIENLAKYYNFKLENKAYSSLK